MKIERLDARELDPATAEEMSDLSAAALAVDAPTAVPSTPQGFLLRIRHGHDDRPYEYVWTARADDGELLGHASVDVPHWDNPQLASLFCDVHPKARGRGVGTGLLEAQVGAATELGRSSLLTFAPKGGDTERFLASHGFEVGQTGAQRRLRPPLIDYANVSRLAEEAATHAVDYELVTLEWPAPEDLLPGLTVLFESINDAPTDEVELEPDAFPVERLRAYGRAMRARRLRTYELLARHRRTEEWAGHTIVCVDETRPGYAAQEDTSVVRSHRGHRLGLLLKASMLLWMREAEPGIDTIDTWNSVTNSPMIAVNEALGCEVSALGVLMQRTL